MNLKLTHSERLSHLSKMMQCKKYAEINYEPHCKFSGHLKTSDLQLQSQDQE